MVEVVRRIEERGAVASEESRTQGRKPRVVSVTREGGHTMAGPETAVNGDSYSYNVLASGEIPVLLDRGELLMPDLTHAFEYGAASAGARQTAGGQR